MSSLSETFEPQQNGSRNYLKEWSDCRRNLIPSGQSKVFSNRVGWAKTHLKNAGLVDSRPTIQSFVGSMEMIRAKNVAVDPLRGCRGSAKSRCSVTHTFS